MDASETFGNPEGTPFKATRVNPLIVPEDPGSLYLGKYTYFCYSSRNMDTAIAIKDMEKWSSVYWGPKVLDAEVMRVIANYFGVHIYNWENDLVYANKYFVTIHAYTSGIKHIFLPKKANVYDVFEENLIGKGIKDFKIKMEIGKTKLFHL